MGRKYKKKIELEIELEDDTNAMLYCPDCYVRSRVKVEEKDYYVTCCRDGCKSRHSIESLRSMIPWVGVDQFLELDK